jgi:hypothetical protein
LVIVGNAETLQPKSVAKPVALVMRSLITKDETQSFQAIHKRKHILWRLTNGSTKLWGRE